MTDLLSQRSIRLSVCKILMPAVHAYRLTAIPSSGTLHPGQRVPSPLL